MTMQAAGFEFMRPAQTGPGAADGDAPASSGRGNALNGMLSGEKGGDSFAAALTDEISRKDPKGRAIVIHPDQVSIREGELPDGLSRVFTLADHLADNPRGERAEVPGGTVSSTIEETPSPEKVPADGSGRVSSGIVPANGGEGSPLEQAWIRGAEGSSRPIDGLAEVPVPASKASRPEAKGPLGSDAKAVGVTGERPVAGDPSKGWDYPLPAGTQPVDARSGGAGERIPVQEGHFPNSKETPGPRSAEGQPVARAPGPVEARPSPVHSAEDGSRPHRGEVRIPPEGGERRSGGQRPEVRPAGQRPGGLARSSGRAPERTLGETVPPRSTAEPVGRAVGPVEARPHEARTAEGGTRPVRAEAPAAPARERTSAGVVPVPHERPVAPRVSAGRVAEAAVPTRQPVDAGERPLSPQGRSVPPPSGPSEQTEPARPFSMTSRPHTSVQSNEPPVQEVLPRTRPAEGNREARMEREPAAPSGKAVPRAPSRPLSTAERHPSPRQEAAVNPREISSVKSADRTGGENRPTPAFGGARELPGNGSREGKPSAATPPLREMAAPPVPPPPPNTPSQPAPLHQESARMNGMAPANPFASGGDASSSGREKRERRTSQLERVEKSGQTQPGSAASAGKLPAAGQRVGYVSEIFSRSLQSIERILEHQSGNRVQLSFKTEGGDDMKVFLKYANGLLQSTFVTDSDSLRMALREGWMQFQRQLAERGVDAHQPDFRHDSGDPRRETRRDDEAPDQDSPGPFGERPVVANRGPGGHQQQPVVASPPADTASSARPHLNTYA